ncbi:MAG TPA: energy transducer TonB [Methylomusa anaerophila]|uniref:Transport protein TonB n=1 Tax=Methylomusa anaerophila TaxID=1930071 RepID=A0A348AM33_9FIRM|nr:energy transducer TonB [Methylomusa anaerophila]BBB92131.1 transport protein TonB [Methylomusa anaerophila]HML87855.1 energy transducer TonB [Methylomusa anaerophila]
MKHGFRWRRAVMISVIFHIFLLAGSGYMAARLVTIPAVIEQYIELDIANEPQIEEPRQNTVAADPQTLPASVAQPVPPASAIRQARPATPAPQAASVADTSPAAAETPAVTGDNEIHNAPAVPAGSGSSTAGNTGGGGNGGGVSPPSILAKVEPVYPKSARQAGIEGTVVVKVQILENGRPGSVAVARSSGYEMLDDAAIAAVREWRFVPAKDRDSGQAVVCYTTMPVSFHLN